MAEGSGLGFIIFYIVFFSVIATLGTYIPNSAFVNASVSEAPNLNDYGSSLTLLDYLDFVFSIVIYFISLQGLTILGINSVVSGIIALGLNVGLIYVVARLVRGGG